MCAPPPICLFGSSRITGPPTRTASGALGFAAGASDDWQTCPSAWAALAPHVRKYAAKRVWQPFYYDGKCAEHLRELGFSDVVHEKRDFFERVTDKKFLKKVDVIMDNPPYTSPETKEAVLGALAASGKPFIMLLPISVLHVAFVRRLLDMRRVQALIPRRVLVRKRNAQSPVPFKYLCWLAYKCDLDSDLIFLDDKNDGEENDDAEDVRAARCGGGGKER